jgi:hypothetical protein
MEGKMKKKLMGILAVLAFTLAISPASPAFEPHPQIRAAINALRNAHEHLEQARHDFGGHKAEAIRAVDEAQRQLETCLQYDKD